MFFQERKKNLSQKSGISSKKKTKINHILSSHRHLLIKFQMNFFFIRSSKEKFFKQISDEANSPLPLINLHN